MSNAPVGLPHIIRSKVYIGPKVSSANQNLFNYYAGIRAGRVIFDILEIYYRFRLVFNFIEHSQLKYRSKITFYVVPKYFGTVKLEEISGLAVIPMFTTHFSVIKYSPGIITNYLVVISNILSTKQEYKKTIKKNVSSYFPDISIGLIDSNSFTNFVKETSRLRLPSISFSDIASQALGLLTYGIPANFSYNSVHLLANTIFMAVKSAFISRMLKFRFFCSSFIFKFFKTRTPSIFKNFHFFVTLINNAYLPFRVSLFSFLNFFITAKLKPFFLKPEVISHYLSNFTTPSAFLEFCNNNFQNSLYYNSKFLNFIFLFRVTFSQLINSSFLKNKKNSSNKTFSKDYTSSFNLKYLPYYNLHSYFSNFFYFKFLTPYLKITSQYFNSNYRNFSLKDKISYLYLNLRSTCNLLPKYFNKFNLLAKTCRRTIKILLKLKMLRLYYPNFSFSVLLKSLLSSCFNNLYVYPNLLNSIKKFSNEINYTDLFKILFYYQRRLVTILQNLMFKCKDSFYSIRVQSHQLLQYYSVFFTNEYLLKSFINSQMLSLERYIKFLGENLHDTFFANIRVSKLNSALKKKYLKLKYNYFRSLKLKYSQPLTVHRLNTVLSRVILKKFNSLKSSNFLEDYLYSLCYYVKTSHLIIKKNLDYLVSIRRLLFDYQRHSKLFFTNRVVYQLEFLLNLPYPKRAYEDYLIAIKLGAYSDYTIECIYKLLKPYFKPYHYYYLILELYKRSTPNLTFIDFRKMANKTTNVKYLSSMKNALQFTLTDINNKNTKTTKLFKLVNFFGRTRADRWVRPVFSDSELQYYAIEKQTNTYKRLPLKHNIERKLPPKRLPNKLINLRRSNVTRFYRILNRLLKVSSDIDSYNRINTLIYQSSYK